MRQRLIGENQTKFNNMNMREGKLSNFISQSPHLALIFTR